MSFYLAKSRAGQYERTPEIREKCHQTHLKNHRGIGIKRSEFTKKRISEAKKRYWAEMTPEQKRKRLDKWIPKKGNKPWNKGKNNPKSQTGENHWNWKGGISPKNHVIRTSKEYDSYRKKIFERDNYTCCLTGQIGGKLVVHHIYSFSDYPEIRFLIDNGVTMSKEKHKEFHSIYGNHHNNLTQFIEFMEV